jgi:hypothetical protein
MRWPVRHRGSTRPNHADGWDIRCTSSFSDTLEAHFQVVRVLAKMLWVGVHIRKKLDGTVRQFFLTLHWKLIVHNHVNGLVLLGAEAANSQLVCRQLHVENISAILALNLRAGQVQDKLWPSPSNAENLPSGLYRAAQVFATGNGREETPFPPHSPVLDRRMVQEVSTASWAQQLKECG